MFVRLAGRVEVNAASLNAQGTSGNLIELTKIRMVESESGVHRLVEVPAVTGNSIKHWHFVHFVTAYTELGGKQLCGYCRRGIGFRSPDTPPSEEEENEEWFVNRCAGEDVHGFLQPDIQVRRESLVKASYLLPLKGMEVGFDTVTHNRVVTSEEGVIEREGMMVIKRQYSSSIFGFCLSLDLWYVGKLLYSPEHKQVIDDEEVKRRGKAALIALLPLLAGDVGASRSRALPAWEVKELVAAWSDRPIPQLTHGCYPDYVAASLDTLKAYAELTGVNINVLTYGIGAVAEEETSAEKTSTGDKGKVCIKEESSWQNLIKSLVNSYEEWLNKKGGKK